MKKTAIILITGFILLTACVIKTPKTANLEHTAPLVTNPPPVTTAIISELEREELNIYQPVADKIAAAFINKDTEYLSKVFEDKSGKGFDFINTLEFIEFEQNGKSFKYFKDGESIHSKPVVYYFNIIVENGKEDLFTLGGREWELWLMDDIGGLVRQFSPKEKEIVKINNNSGYNIKLCYQFSNDLIVFESMDDFNIINIDSKKYDNFWYNNYHMLSHNIYNNFYLPSSDNDYITFSVEELIKLAEYHYSITNIDADKADYDGKGNARICGHGWHWHYPEVVSEEITDTNGIIIINYYGDTGYFLLAKTMKYNLIFSDKGTKLISVECLYSNDELILAVGVV